MEWNSERPHVLVVACSDGRLQEATDQFLAGELGIRHYDRLYVPGGGGALSASGRDYMRAHQLQQECRYLIELHEVQRLIALFHGPAADGPPGSMCADYKRKMPWANIEAQRQQQEKDAFELLESRWQWAGKANLAIYRCEVAADGTPDFVSLHRDPLSGRPPSR